MDLQVCEPDLATASPSAIAGCADKLESCKVLYVSVGATHSCRRGQSMAKEAMQAPVSALGLEFAAYDGC